MPKICWRQERRTKRRGAPGDWKEAVCPKWVLWGECPRRKFEYRCVFVRVRFAEMHVRVYMYKLLYSDFSASVLAMMLGNCTRNMRTLTLYFCCMHVASTGTILHLFICACVHIGQPVMSCGCGHVIQSLRAYHWARIDRLLECRVDWLIDFICVTTMLENVHKILPYLNKQEVTMAQHRIKFAKTFP